MVLASARRQGVKAMYLQKIVDGKYHRAEETESFKTDQTTKLSEKVKKQLNHDVTNADVDEKKRR